MANEKEIKESMAEGHMKSNLNDSQESPLKLGLFPKHDISCADSSSKANDVLRSTNSTSDNLIKNSGKHLKERFEGKQLNSEVTSSEDKNQILNSGKQECYTLDDSSSDSEFEDRLLVKYKPNNWTVSISDSEDENGTVSLKSESKPSNSKSLSKKITPPLKKQIKSKTKIEQLNSRQSSIEHKLVSTVKQECYTLDDSSSDSELHDRLHITCKPNNWTSVSSNVISISDSEDENGIVLLDCDSKPSDAKSPFKTRFKSKTQITNSAINSKKTNSEIVNDKSPVPVESSGSSDSYFSSKLKNSHSAVFVQNKFHSKEFQLNNSSDSDDTHVKTSVFQKKSNLDSPSHSSSQSYKNQLNQSKSPLDIGAVKDALKGVKRTTEFMCLLPILPQKKQKRNDSFSNVSKSNLSANENTPVTLISSKEQDAELHKALSTNYKTDDYNKLASLNYIDLVLNSEPFECLICFSNIASGEGVVLHDCLHSFCKLCLAAVVQHSETALVKCPFNDGYACESNLQEREVKSLVTNDIFEKYLQRSMTLAESQARDSFHCKTINCHGWCLYEDNVNFFLCPVCEKNNCLTCAAIHEGKNCQQYQDYVAFNSDTDEEAKRTKKHLEDLLKNNEAKKCPQCKVIIIKKGGCDDMICSMCFKRFSWSGKGPQYNSEGLIQFATHYFHDLRTTNYFQEQYPATIRLGSSGDRYRPNLFRQSTGSQPRSSINFGPNFRSRSLLQRVQFIKEPEAKASAAWDDPVDNNQLEQLQTQPATQPQASTSKADDSTDWFRFEQQWDDLFLLGIPPGRGLLHSSPDQQQKEDSLQSLKQKPNSYLMHVQCRGCNKITTVVSDSQAVILCDICRTVLCEPTGGLARPTENSLVISEKSL